MIHRTPREVLTQSSSPEIATTIRDTHVHEITKSIGVMADGGSFVGFIRGPEGSMLGASIELSRDQVLALGQQCLDLAGPKD